MTLQLFSALLARFLKNVKWNTRTYSQSAFSVGYLQWKVVFLKTAIFTDLWQFKIFLFCIPKCQFPTVMEVTYTDSLNSFSRQGTTRTAEIHMCGFHSDIFAMEAKASQRVVEQLVRSHSLVSCWYSLGVVCQTPKTVNGCLDHLRGLPSSVRH